MLAILIIKTILPPFHDTNTNKTDQYLDKNPDDPANPAAEQPD
jgi:hypothetical protein